MGIFYRRRLCLFCCLFCLASLVAWFLSASALMWIGTAILLLAALACALFWKPRFHSRRCLTCMLCLAFTLAALLHSYLWIDLPEQKAEAYEGEHIVQARIVETQYRSSYHSQYLVKLLGIDEEATDLTAVLSCPSNAELAAGDTVYASAVLESATRDSDGALLIAAVEEETKIYVRRTSEEPVLTTLTSRGGIRILSNRVRSHLRQICISHLGEEVGALASAFLLGDRSELSSRITLDFQRAGVSHMMAVSGLHIAILFGSVELVLRRLYVPKRLRCATVAVVGVVFLFLTGFSLSACRSVLMLFFVYLFYFLREGNDSLTALFTSIALILLISPRAVADLGMWMSFLATLGLLTLYPICERKLRRSSKRGVVGICLRAGRRVLLLMLMTVIANLFLLPVIWLFFGEFSLVALLSNVVLSPLSYVFLLGIPLFLMTVAVPWVGTAIQWGLGMLGAGMIDAVRVFSQLPHATVSLNYGFCYVLIPLFTVTMTVLLIVRLRHKRWLILPGAVTVLAFVLCLGITRLTDRDARLTYQTDQSRNEILTVTEGDSFVICDVSRGSWVTYRRAWERYRASTATEIDGILLTHYHQGHRMGLDWLMQRTVVRRLYLPAPRDAESRAVATELYLLASELDTEVIFYDGAEALSLTERVSVVPQNVSEDGAHPQVSLSFVGAETVTTYLSPRISPTPNQLRYSNRLILGSHGTLADDSEEPWQLPEDSRLDTVVYTHDEIPKNAALFGSTIKVYAPREQTTDYTVSFFLP